MYIANATFIVEQKEREQFIEWIRTRKEELETSSHALRLAMVAALPGDPDFTSHAASFSLQTDCDTLEDAMKWLSANIGPVAVEFAERFSQEAVVFSSIIEKIPI